MIRVSLFLLLIVLLFQLGMQQDKSRTVTERKRPAAAALDKTHISRRDVGPVSIYSATMPDWDAQATALPLDLTNSTALDPRLIKVRLVSE